MNPKNFIDETGHRYGRNTGLKNAKQRRPHNEHENAVPLRGLSPEA